MTTIINGSSPSITFSDGSAQTSATRPFLNRIINGAMVIDQRNAGASVSVDGTTVYTLDRWMAIEQTGGVFSVQQVSDAPSGFNYSLKATVTTADSSITTTELALVRQRIEGFNFADLMWGTANARTITLSFWVKSSLTGTFGGALINSDADRSYPYSYTISSANTWEQKSITIAGDTTGTWFTTNGVAVQVDWSLAVGSTYAGTAGAWAGAVYLGVTGQTQVMSTLNATFQITGVQLEVGSTATSFDYRPYGTELALCQRYYYKLLPAAANPVLSNGYCATTTTARLLTQFLVSMRTRPTALEQNGTAGDYSIYDASGEIVCNSVPTFLFASTDSAAVVFTVASGLTAGQGLFGITNSTTSFLAWSAEL
jgi:hypothetical protein